MDDPKCPVDDLASVVHRWKINPGGSISQRSFHGFMVSSRAFKSISIMSSGTSECSGNSRSHPDVCQMSSVCSQKPRLTQRLRVVKKVYDYMKIECCTCIQIEKIFTKIFFRSRKLPFCICLWISYWLQLLSAISFFFLIFTALLDASGCRFVSSLLDCVFSRLFLFT